MNYCENCGKNNPETAVFCAGCGINLNQAKAEEESRKTEQLKKRVPIAALTLSVCGLICFIALPAQIIGLALGIYGLKLNQRKNTLSLISIILSVLGIFLFILLAVLVAVNFDSVVSQEIFSLIGSNIG